MISCLSLAKSQFEPNSCQHNYLQIVTKVDNLAVLALCTYTNVYIKLKVSQPHYRNYMNRKSQIRKSGYVHIVFKNKYSH